jgi:predicted metal-dependent hydrolase
MTRLSVASVTQERAVEICGRRVRYTLVSSRTTKRLRIRVGLRGVEVIRPVSRGIAAAQSFLVEHGPWVLDQLHRARRLHAALRTVRLPAGQIPLRGAPTQVCVREEQNRSRCNKVAVVEGKILVLRGGRSTTAPSRSLEVWLRKQARDAIEDKLRALTERLGQKPSRIYIMCQRTKWGSCSSRRNLSFNWRLVLAPEFVLQYLVTHEAVHLAVPDHSAKFWLTVRGLCPDTERARQWLRASGPDVAADLMAVCSAGRNAGDISLAETETDVASEESVRDGQHGRGGR